MWSSRSPNVTLFLQLCKTSCGTRTDIPHVFFSFCDSACSNCLHPFPLPLIFFIVLLPPLSSPLSVSLSDLADNLAMDDFTFQEQLLTPRLATAGVGGVSSPAPPLWRCYLVPTLPMTLALLLLCRHWPVHSHVSPIQQKLCGTGETFWSRCKVQRLIKGSVNNKQCHISHWHVLFYLKSLDVLNNPLKHTR